MIKVSITGIDQVLNRLRGMPAKLSPAVRQGMSDFESNVRNDTIPNAPIDTGNLRKSYYAVCDTAVIYGANPSFVEKKGRRARNSRTRMSTDHHAALANAISGTNYVMSGVALIIGYSAYYAPIVHDFNKTGSPLFFQNSVEKNKSGLRLHILNRMSTKGII